ncbi:type II toxin-antitoxin system YafQ family toxin [Helicobacter colisuis]|uniref:type II toxin-antitoxin system YafQ family toxin n=1 Tax=Helicobacter colisuis TaxID=2949739 RepID=UPI00202A2626|nr:type II toxin-antitoxin system YafQ family toxin [Helicobacter colisuis]MCL9823055.1 type II toxin-antitoxin system YafQ family toxin [Helicobacter colisuis]
MLKLIVENSFDRDYKREKKSGLETELLLNIINKLQAQIPLDKKHKDHALKGDLKDFRECHLKSDLCLIYQIREDCLHLVRLGSHSKLFKK